MVLPEVGKRRSGASDVAGIASTRRARRESHGKIFTLGVLREESKQLVKAVVDATIRFLAKRWKCPSRSAVFPTSRRRPSFTISGALSAVM